MSIVQIVPSLSTGKRERNGGSLGAESHRNDTLQEVAVKVSVNTPWSIGRNSDRIPFRQIWASRGFFIVREYGFSGEG